MAKKQLRPGRTLVRFFVGTAIAFGLVALTGTWQPGLGLDLQGGTRITLQAKGNPSQTSLKQARNIIDDRVNGSGVTEAEVSTEGGNLIAVEIPGKQRRDLVETVQRQAQLRFRLVACSDADPCVSSTTPPGTLPPTTPGASTPPGATTNPQTDSPPSSPAANNRPPAGKALDDSGAPSSKPTKTPSADPTPTPTPTQTDAPTGTPTDSPTGTPTDAPSAPTTDEPVDNGFVSPVADELAWSRSPDDAAIQLFNSYACSADGTLTRADGSAAQEVDDPAKPLVACAPPEGDKSDTQNYRPAIKYLLSKAVIEGTDLDDASYGTPQNGVGYVVNLQIGGGGKDAFSEASRTLQANAEQFAIVLDGLVISAPTFTSPIPDGNAQITGDFSDAEARGLSTSLKYGALPISFDSSVDEIGPSLAGDQLTAGITAGIFGLGLVMIYCLVYYRGLGLVVLASLVMASAITYAMVLLLSETAGFTLTLPGIAGLIIAVGITADSFVIFFERIRDEMRDGKSMRVAVEVGWVRARNTTLAADGVSLLAAVVLYIFAAGVVKGFAFALGLSTLIDLVVFFYFTKPMVSYLARYRFFNRGHRMSGLSAETLGVDALPAGGKA